MLPIIFQFFYYRSICIIDNGASSRRTRNARFRGRRARNHVKVFPIRLYVQILIRQTKKTYPKHLSKILALFTQSRFLAKSQKRPQSASCKRLFSIPHFLEAFPRF